MAVFFHGSFGMNRDRMAGVLKSALKDPTAKDGTLANPFGYGAPFGARYRAWLRWSGLTNGELPVRLTPLGEIVWKNHKRLSTTITQWFLHHALTGDPNGAKDWHCFATEFLPGRSRFTKRDLMTGLMKKLSSHDKNPSAPTAR